MKKIVSLVLLFSLCCLAYSVEKTYGNVVITKVVSVYDGDTFTAAIDTYPAIVGDRINIRVSGIDTPEMRGKSATEKVLARKAKAEAKKILTTGKVVELRNIRRDKYFRILAEVYVDGKSLAKYLINKGLAVPYEGGTKINWANGLPSTSNSQFTETHEQ